MTTLARWSSLTADVPGYFMAESAAMWDVLLEHQEARGVAGSLAEIGVLRGKSAVLAALHARERESLLLVDLSFPEETRRLLGSIVRPDAVQFVESRSSRLVSSPTLAHVARACRWVHIDGEHTGHAVTNDLALASQWLAEDGVICVDDFFNPAYPQVSAAVFAWLQARPFELTLFLCGYNKGYLCRPSRAQPYLELLAHRGASALSGRGVRGVTLFKTTWPSDMNCFGMAPRFGDRDVYGLDEDPSRIPL